MAVALLSDEQLRALLEEAAERGARRALEQTRASELTTAQAAELLGVKPKTVRKMVRDRRLQVSRKVGKDFRFKASDVDLAKTGGPISGDAASMVESLGVR